MLKSLNTAKTFNFLHMPTRYGLLGHPLGHSFSRRFHNERFERLGIDAEYVNFDLPSIDDLPAVLASEPQLRGLNVTIPYKQQVMRYLDALDPLAERIGAVNTICVEHLAEADGSTRLPGLRLTGYNTDIIGFRQSLEPLLVEAGVLQAVDGQARPAEGQAPQALVLGTGGASKAVVVALEDWGITPHLVSRTAAPGRLTYDDLTAEVMRSHRVVVNCSPVGMFPNVDDAPAIPYEHIGEGHVCYDLIYNPAETRFLRQSREQGARTMSGGAMLEGQALAAYAHWTAKD